MSIIKAGNAVFSYEIQSARVYAATQVVKADIMVGTAPAVLDIMHLVADVIGRTKPVQLPMTWSMYNERIWREESVEPVISIHPGRVAWNDIDCVYAGNAGHRPMQEVTKAAVTIHVSCEPSWETYRRWSSVIIDDFYKAVRAARDYFGINWEDISKTQNVSWGEVEFRYISKEPVSVIRQGIEEIERYGELIRERVTDVYLHFALTIPNFPDDKKSAANCHVIEEEVTVTSTKKVKRLRCE